MVAFLALLIAVLLVGSLFYCLLILIAARHYLAQPRGSAFDTPISILKPLSGADQGLETNLRSFFEQDYQKFEVLAAVRDPADPAAAVFAQFQHEFPAVTSRLIVTGEPPYANAKVFSLARMFAQASHELVVMSDSDIRVDPNFLSSIAFEFSDPEIDLATCPYRACAGPSIWSRLEAQGMNTEFLGGLLVARLLTGVDFAVGPTIVARCEVLEKVGFEHLKEYLAEDFVMGREASEAGFGVALSRTIVEHRIGSEAFRANALHRLRWARSTRRSRPAGYLGQIFTNPVPLALALCLLHPAWWPLFIPVAILRGLAARAVASNILQFPPDWLLLYVQDLLSFAFWLAGFFGNTITWRGRRYYLHPDGRFELLA